MNSDRFFPTCSAARSIKVRVAVSARRLIVTPRAARSVVLVFRMAVLLYGHALYISVYTQSTRKTGRAIARRNLSSRLTMTAAVVAKCDDVRGVAAIEARGQLAERRLGDSAIGRLGT